MATSTSVSRPRRLDDFEIIGELGRGGIGLTPKAADSFRREATAAAFLGLWISSVPSPPKAQMSAWYFGTGSAVAEIMFGVAA
jgi:hypothetical protein